MEPYTSVIHAKNLLMNLKKNYNVVENFIEFCRRAERDQLHERDSDVFRFVIKTFFCWNRSEQLFKNGTEESILRQWDEDIARWNSVYKSYSDIPYLTWYTVTDRIKREVLKEVSSDYAIKNCMYRLRVNSAASSFADGTSSEPTSLDM